MENSESNIKTWPQIEETILEITKKLKFSHTEIYTMSRGGLVPARLLADHFNCKKIIVDSEKIPDNAVFVDDIYDSGKTYHDVSKIAGKGLVFVTLYLRKGQKPPSNLVYARQTEGDEYIVFPWDKVEYEQNSEK